MIVLSCVCEFKTWRYVRLICSKNLEPHPLLSGLPSLMCTIIIGIELHYSNKRTCLPHKFLKPALKTTYGHVLILLLYLLLTSVRRPQPFFGGPKMDRFHCSDIGAYVVRKSSSIYHFTSRKLFWKYVRRWMHQVKILVFASIEEIVFFWYNTISLQFMSQVYPFLRVSFSMVNFI